MTARKFIEPMLDYSNNKEFIGFQYTDVKGSPYFSDKWLKGKVLLSDQLWVENLQLKFDEYNNHFIVNWHDTAFQISTVVKQIVLYPGSDTLNKLVFKNGYAINAKIDAKIYLEVLAEGKMSFLRYPKKEIDKYTEYGDATKYERFEEVHKYFIFVNSNFKEVTLTKKNLQDVLHDKWAQVSEYLAKFKADPKTIDGWKLVIGYYNSL
jgi:hypothetical protein